MRVPVLTNPGVGEEAQPTPYNPNGGLLDAPARQFQQATNEFSSTLTQQTRAYHERATADRVSQADAQFGHFINDAAWSPDQEKDSAGNDTGVAKGFLLKLGQNAFDTKPYLDSLAKQQKNISESLVDNPDAQRLFNLKAAGRLQTAQEEAERHSGQQQRVVSQQNYDAQEKLAMDTIGLAHGTPDEVLSTANDAVQHALGPMAVHLVHNLGLSPEAARAELIKFQSGGYAKAVQALLDTGDGMGAEELYGKVKDKLGPLAPEVEKSIRPLVMAQTAGLQSRDIISKSLVKGDGTAFDASDPAASNTDPTKLRLDDSKALAEWDKLPEGAQKQKTLEVLRERMSTYQQSHEREQVQAFGRVVQEIEHNDGHLNESGSNFLSLDDQYRGKALEQAMTIRRKMRSEANLDNRDDRRVQRQYDSDAVAEFGTMARDKQVKADVDSMFPNARPEVRQRLKNLQGKNQEELAKDAGEKLGEFDRTVNESLSTLKGVPKDQLGVARTQLDAWWHQQKDKNNGAPPTTEEVQKEISRKLTYGPTGKLSIGPISFDRNSMYEFQAEDQGKTGTFTPAAPEKQKFGGAKTAPVQTAVGPGTQAGSGGQSPAPATTRTVGNKTYVKRNGKWFEE